MAVSFNLALGKTVTGSAAVTNATLITDGSTATDPYASIATTGLQYVQVDLGAIYNIDTIKVWHYWADGRIYNNTRTQVSADGSNWVDVFNSATSGTYAETSTGKTHLFSATSARYVRDYINGSNANAGNHWIEIQAYGSGNPNYAIANRNYVKQVSISTASSSLSNYQQNITVVYVAGKMANDFSDLIFLDALGNNLSYWIESKTDGTSASVWVKITTSTTTASGIYMYYGVGETITSPSNIDNVMDAGLRFFYYTGTAFNTYIGTAIDTAPNYNWGSGAVTINGVGGYSDNLSIYWTGWVKPDGLGTTVMYCASDDGQRMYINGSLVIDNWVDQGETERSYSFNMQSIASIRYNYYENGGGAVARIGWDSVNSAKAYPIPSTYLRCKKYLSTEPTITFGTEEYAVSINTLKVPRRDRFPGAI